MFLYMNEALIVFFVYVKFSGFYIELYLHPVQSCQYCRLRTFLSLAENALKCFSLMHNVAVLALLVTDFSFFRRVILKALKTVITVFILGTQHERDSVENKSVR